MTETMTSKMLEWAIAHYEGTGQEEFSVDRKFQRAAAQHYSSTWVVRGYWVTLRPPPMLIPDGSYRVKVEVFSDE